MYLQIDSIYNLKYAVSADLNVPELHTKMLLYHKVVKKSYESIKIGSLKVRTIRI